MNKIISTLDGSNVKFYLNIDDSNKKHKSLLGGLISFCIYLLSAIYFTYNIVIWQSGYLPPINRVQSMATSELEYIFKDDFLTFYGDPYRDNFYEGPNYDPFDPNYMILEPVLLVFENSIQLENSEFQYQLIQREDKYYQVVLSNQTLYTSDVKQIDLTLSFTQCRNETIEEGRRCAPQSVIEQFLNQEQNFMTYKLKEHQYNSQTKDTDTISTRVDVFLDPIVTQYRQIYCNIQQTIIDDAPLFTNERKLTYLNKFQSYDQSIALQRLDDSKVGVYFLFYFKLSPLLSQQEVRYPKLNEILANAGSIISLLFHIFILIQAFNENDLESKLIKEIISFYYPQFKNVVIAKNIFGRIKKVQYNKELINVEQFKVFYSKIQSIAQKKCSVSNILYELSRIQFILQSLQQRRLIQKSHDIGISIPNFKTILTSRQEFEKQKFKSQQTSCKMTISHQ